MVKSQMISLNILTVVTKITVLTQVLQRLLVAVVAEVVHHMLLELLLGADGEHGLAHGAQLALAGARGGGSDADQDSVLLHVLHGGARGHVALVTALRGCSLITSSNFGVF